MGFCVGVFVFLTHPIPFNYFCTKYVLLLYNNKMSQYNEESDTDTYDSYDYEEELYNDIINIIDNYKPKNIFTKKKI